MNSSTITTYIMNCFNLSKSVFIILSYIIIYNLLVLLILKTPFQRAAVKRSLLRKEHDRGDRRSMAGCDESMDTSDKVFTRLAIFTSSIEIVEQETYSEGYLGSEMPYHVLED